MTADAGFLSRWSRRKQAEREGVVLPEPAPAEHVPAVAAALESPAPPPPTLHDVAALTPTSDFTRFVARDVDPGVRNAALRTLFSDPHFNLMDGLDTYMDDYGRPDPLPDGMLRQLVQSQFLNLFADDPEASDEDPDLRLQPHDAAGPAGPEPGAEPNHGSQP
jgi:hypothetical protein